MRFWRKSRRRFPILAGRSGDERNSATELVLAMDSRLRAAVCLSSLKMPCGGPQLLNGATKIWIETGRARFGDRHRRGSKARSARESHSVLPAREVPAPYWATSTKR